MKVLPRTYKQSRIQQAHYSDDEEQVMLNYEDVETFLNADCEIDYQELMRKYSSPFQPLYGTKEYFRDGARRGVAFSNVRETTNDFLNLKHLLSAGLSLCALLEKSSVGYWNIEYCNEFKTLNVKVEEETFFGDCYSLGIELEDEPETKAYLKKGLDNVTLQFPRCDLIECSNGDGATTKFMLHISTGLIKSTPERLRNACISLLDALSSIMLHDLSVGVSGGRVYQVCESTASSLWYALLEGFREGRADFCDVCGTPFIALDERKNPRLYCRPACNKMHQRFMKYRKYLKAGNTEKEAAKKAGVALARVKKYWASHTDTSAHEGCCSDNPISNEDMEGGEENGQT